MNTQKDNSNGAEFLEWDFMECYAQMRHYDTQLWDVWKFSLTAYSTLLGTSLAAHQFSVEKHIDLVPATLAILLVGLLLGLVFLGLAVRTRMYYVVVARYINQYRGYFLAMKPNGFEDFTGMYKDSQYPKYFNWRSSQEWLMYSIAVLNSALVGVFLWMTLPSAWKMLGIIILPLIFLALQLFFSIRSLQNCEKKFPSHFIFGNRESSSENVDH